MTTLGSTDRTRLRRHPERAQAQRRSLYDLLAQCLIVHVGTTAPRVMPMAFGRIDDQLYLHGGRPHGTLQPGEAVCVTATIIDGIVVARSAFHHSMNYRSALIYGRLREVRGDEELRALDAILEHALPGRAAECRPPSQGERKATIVVAVDLAEASVKVRAGPPKESKVDADAQVWNGVLPVALRPARLEPAIDLDVPASVQAAEARIAKSAG